MWVLNSYTNYNLSFCSQVHGVRRLHFQLAERIVFNLQDVPCPVHVWGQPVFMPFHSSLSHAARRILSVAGIHVAVSQVCF